MALHVTSLQAPRARIVEFEMSVHQICANLTVIKFCRKTDRKTESRTDIAVKIVVQIDIILWACIYKKKLLFIQNRVSGSSHILHASKLEIVVEHYLLFNTLHYCVGKIS